MISMVVLVAGCDEGESEEVQTVPGAAADQQTGVDLPGCDELPTAEELKAYLQEAVSDEQIGGLFGGTMEWLAVTNRSGQICAVAVGTDTVTAAWPGSRGIAMAKAYTANGFSTDNKPMSTARLYTMSMPGRSLYGAFVGNPFNPECMTAEFGTDDLEGKICGGTIGLGGGLPLYVGNQVIGGLGASGDTPCADHEVAKRVRALANLVPPGGNSVDDIVYVPEDGQSLYAHPVCLNTWKNGRLIGDPPPSDGYGEDPL